MIRRTLLLCSLFALPLICAAGDVSDEDRKDARSAADSLLALIDDGDFDAAWQLASPEAKKRGDGDQFREEMSAAQEQLGERTSRELQASEFVTELPEMPQGTYALFRFSSEFRTVGEVDEGISLAKQADGEWAMMGYFVQPRR